MFLFDISIRGENSSSSSDSSGELNNLYIFLSSFYFLVFYILVILIVMYFSISEEEVIINADYNTVYWKVGVIFISHKSGGLDTLSLNVGELIGVHLQRRKNSRISWRNPERHLIFRQNLLKTGLRTYPPKVGFIYAFA